MTKSLRLAIGVSNAHQFHIALGDLPTWALFVGAFAAALIALRQLRLQQDDSAKQTRQLERQQANDVDLTWRSAADVLIRTTVPGNVTTAGRTVVVVENNSRRPIRNITCWIQLQQPPERLEPLMLGPVGEPPGTNFEFSLDNPRIGTRYPLMRPKSKYGFLFGYEVPKDDATATEPQADRPMVQFIDDAGLTWQIDDDLRLQRIEPPTPPWHGLLGQ